MNRFPALVPLLLGLCGVSPAGLDAADSPSRLDRTRLLEYRDSQGTIRTATSPEEWERRRAEMVKGMQAIMGVLPALDPSLPLDVQVESETDEGTVVRRLITYQSEPGSRVPAYLSIPKGALEGSACVGAVLCLHPTDNQVGHMVVVGLGGKPNRAYARELAERGYVTLAPSYPLLANYQPDLEALGYASGTLKAIRDNMRGLDLLASLPFVKTNGFGAIGHSLGGHNAVFTAALDARIKVIVSSCGLDSFMDYKDGDIRGWTSTRYMPRLLDYRDRLEDIPFDFHELIASLAPRTCFLSAPLGDDNFMWRSVDAIVEAARPVYELHGAENRLQVAHPECGHDFPPEMRERAYMMMDEVLGK